MFLEGAIHLLQGRGGVSARPPWLVTLDSRRLGPVLGDERADLEARLAYWRESARRYLGRARAATTRELRDEHDLHRDLAARIDEVDPRAPIVVWVGRDWSELLFAWRVLERIERGRDLDPTRVRVVWLPWALDPHGPRLRQTHAFISLTVALGDGASHSDAHRAALARALSRAAPLARSVLRAAATMWRRYTDPDPRAFVRACLTPGAPFPSLAQLSTEHRALFPRRGARDRLLLSAYDRWLLAGLSLAEPRRPYEPIRERVRGPHFLARGDWTLAGRLHAWSERGFVERVDLQPSAMHTRYCLTERGRRLLTRGLDDPDDAPIDHAGGATLYRGPRAWALRGRHVVAL